MDKELIIIILTIIVIGISIFFDERKKDDA